MAKNDLYEMAQTLGIKKEKLDAGLKVNQKGVEDAVSKAYAFKTKKR